MTNELSKNLVCVLIRNGVELWVESERADKLKGILLSKDCPQFIEYNGQLINKSDITGIYDALTMEEKSLRKNGKWKCDKNNWHDRYERCSCLTLEQIKIKEKNREDHIKIYGVEPLY